MFKYISNCFLKVNFINLIFEFLEKPKVAVTYQKRNFKVLSGNILFVLQEGGNTIGET